MTPEPEPRVALVTGGSRGIGRAIALALARAGIAVVFTYRERSDAAETVVQQARGFGGKVTALKSDASDEREAGSVVETTLRTHERLDYVVANAGIVTPRSWNTLDRAAWRTTLETNLLGPFDLLRASEKALRAAHGGAVMIASISGLLPATPEVDYNVSKAGLLMLTRCLALALAPEVRVNAVAPGWIATDMNREEYQNARFRRRVEAATPLGRWGEPEDVARAVLFLLGDGARFITGETLVVDGGEQLHRRFQEPVE